MICFSHAREDENRNKIPVKKLVKHLTDVTDNIDFNFHPYLNFKEILLFPELLT